MNDSELFFARPSFIGGLASTLDIGSTLSVYNESVAPHIADAHAIHSDWKSVGNDLRFAMSRIK